MSAPIHAHIGSFENADGMRFYAEWWTPQQPTAVLILVHGISEHSGRYGPFIQHFVKRGFAVATYDQRGHGKSEGPRGEIKHLQDFVSDLSDFLRVTKERYPELPCFVVGHSFGGQVVINHAVRSTQGIDGVILSSPNIGLKMRIPRWKLWMIDKLHARYPDMRLPHSIDPKWLSHDPSVVERYRNDPRVVRAITLHGAREIFRNLEVMMAFASRLHVPCLFLHAGDDHVCCPQATQDFFRRVPVAKKSIKIYEGLYHELFNERDCATVFEDLESWVDSVVFPVEHETQQRQDALGHMPVYGHGDDETKGESWWGESH